MPVPRWKNAGSVAMFPSRNAEPDRRNRFARVASVAKAVFLWLRTGKVKHRDAPENFPVQNRLAGQTAQTTGH